MLPFMNLALPVLLATLAGCTATLHEDRGCTPPACIAPADPALRDAKERIVAADYQGDLAALAQAAARLEPYVHDPARAGHARYWRGFAWWRRAINAANAADADADAIRDDLDRARGEFDAAIDRDAEDQECAIGLLGVLQMRLFFTARDDPAYPALLEALVPVARTLAVTAANNPRYLWLRGGTDFYVPPPIGRGADAALATYHRGIAEALAAPAPGDPLAPTWGLPELTMSVAYVHAHRSEPDLAAAERFAEAALRLRGDWAYVRDQLIPGIRARRADG